MTLFQATLFTGIFLIAIGGHFLWHGIASALQMQAFPRSKAAAYLLLGISTAWFLYKILNLGPADFGQYKKLLFALFLGTAVGSFYFVPDFLAVRGLAALTLLSADVLLDAAYMQLPQARLFLVSFIYLAIILALILGASPFKLRDFFDWLYRTKKRPRIFGAALALYGAFLSILAFSY